MTGTGRIRETVCVLLRQPEQEGAMGKHLELTPRLRQIAAWVRQGAHLADVGTDHAYLPVWLTLQGRVASAIASDLRRGPLDRAQETGRRYGVGDRITFRLGNGLAAVAPEECDTIVIAGMGGENIAQILAGAPWTADGRHTLLLQPQSRAEALRRFLAEHGYAIAREALVRDRGFLYPVIEAGAGEMHLTLGRQWAGADLLYDPLGDRYIIEKIIQLQAAAAGANRASAPEARERGDYARAVITELLQMREEWRHANCPGN